MLESLYNELTETVHSTHRIYMAAKIPEDYFTHPFKLNHKARSIFNKKYMSLEKILTLWIPKWKSEGRLKYTPIRVQINDEEARLLDTQKQEVQLPELYSLMFGLFLFS